MPPLTATQLDVRRHGVGASDIPVLAGLVPGKGPWDVWLDKTRQDDVMADLAWIRWGHRLEPAIAGAAVEEMHAEHPTGPPLHPLAVPTLRHAGRDWMLATPDRLVIPGEEVPEAITRWCAVATKAGVGVLPHGRFLPEGTQGLECKNRNVWHTRDWGEPGTAEVPDAVAAQCLWNLEVTGLDLWRPAVLLGGFDFRLYRIERQPAVIAALIAVGEAFYRDCLVADRPPALDDSTAAADYIAQTFRTHGEAMRDATQAEDALAREYFGTRSERELLETRERGLRTKLQEMIGTAKGLRGLDGWRLSWSQTQGRMRTDWEQIALALAAQYHVPLDVQTALKDQYTSRGEGYRTFRATPPKE